MIVHSRDPLNAETRARNLAASPPHRPPAELGMSESDGLGAPLDMQPLQEQRRAAAFLTS